MGTYFSVPVHLRTNAQWYQTLKNAIPEGIHVNWRTGHFHITLAFMDAINSDFNPARMHFREGQNLRLTLDKLEVFLTSSGKEFIIDITAQKSPHRFDNFVSNLQDYLKSKGCHIAQESFKLHISLGSIVVDDKVSLADLEQAVKSVKLPPFEIALQELRYIKQGTKQPLMKWHI